MYNQGTGNVFHIPLCFHFGIDRPKKKTTTTTKPKRKYLFETIINKKGRETI